MGYIRRIKKNRSYTVKEFSKVLNLHEVTVFKLIKLSKLEYTGFYDSAKIYDGDNFKKFLLKRCLDKKIHLEELEMYCLKCRKAVDVKDIKIVDKGITIGKGIKEYIVSGKCITCERMTNKFVTLIPESWSKIPIQISEYKPKTKLKKENDKVIIKISKDTNSNQFSFIKPNQKDE